MQSRSIVEAFRFAFSGLWYAVRTQRNMRIQLAVAAVVGVLGVWIGLTPEEWAVLTLTVGMVLFSEITNTVIERLVDLVSPDYHPLAKIVKDVMAGAVVIAAAVAVVVGLLILGPPLRDKLTG